MTNRFTGAAQAVSVSDFNARVARLSDQIGPVRKPDQPVRGARFDRNRKPAPAPVAAPDSAASQD